MLGAGTGEGGTRARENRTPWGQMRRGAQYTVVWCIFSTSRGRYRGEGRGPLRPGLWKCPFELAGARPTAPDPSFNVRPAPPGSMPEVMSHLHPLLRQVSGPGTNPGLPRSVRLPRKPTRPARKDPHQGPEALRRSAAAVRADSLTDLAGKGHAGREFGRGRVETAGIRGRYLPPVGE